MSIRLLALILVAPALAATVRGAPVNFSRDIKPLFNKHCSACHGGVKHSGDLSLVYHNKVLEPAKSGKIPVVPGNIEKSEIIARVTSTDDDEVMPPPKKGKRLPDTDVQLLKDWIKQGAPWDEHWAFVAPKKPAAPAIKDASWPKQSLDAFVLAKLESAGLKPSPEADGAQWLRRVTLDLTGLPPAPDDMKALEVLPYEAIVDRLLKSPAFGERWASVWLDLSRYADSQGYEADKPRIIWPYRDWLIRAFNADMPFDQFAIKQLAGDLVPKATLDDRVATAFHRNTPTNSEGGTDDEEFRVVAVVDRIATTWRAFQGVTFNCVQCHSHPYDPFENTEYYRFMSFFNTQKDWDMAEDEPKLRVPLKGADFAKAQQLDDQMLALRTAKVSEMMQRSGSAKWTALEPCCVQSSGQTKLVTKKADDGITDVVAQGTVSHYSVFTIDAPVPAETKKLTALKMDALPLDPVKAKSTAELGFVVSLLRAIVVTPETEKEVLAATDAPPEKEVDVAVDPNTKKKVSSPPAPKGVPNPPAQPGEITFTYALGDEADPVFDAQTTLKDDKGGWGANPRMTHARRLVLIPSKPVDLPANAKLRILMRHDEGGFGYAPLVTNRSRFAISDSNEWTSYTSSKAFADREAQLAKLEKDRSAIANALMPVIEEQDTHLKRQTATFVRGNWLDKGETVEPTIPAVFGTMPKSKDPARLALAKWMVSEKNPLTARVAVNRFWEQLFGTGIVETLEDFGSSGQAPSNQALLDHLAVRFQTDLGWSMKKLLREIVLSATYRQSAKTSPELRERDPRNRLLARGPRTRLTAEMVRDNALFVSGLLSPKMFGPPVMPVQPDGIWRAARSGLKWKNAEGDDAHRRSLYTYWRRSSPYPSSLTFDAPDRLLCTARRTATNTPLQALVTLNDPVFMEAAVALAARVEKAGDLKTQITQAYELATGSQPSPSDTTDLIALREASLTEYKADAKLAKSLGSTPEKAALAVVANAILNLDAVLTK
ncbi:MAG: PSD1 and planctomycete cytochrome C domain-containing protein [Verrucomicrobiaceae bacterium]|nr:PSD1 and planctomycete cytochrome C domain-containing protein [Verrucomicrobiaceae bacterium]